MPYISESEYSEKVHALTALSDRNDSLLSVQKQLVEALEEAAVALEDARASMRSHSNHMKSQQQALTVLGQVPPISDAIAVVRAAILAAKASS